MTPKNIKRVNQLYQDARTEYVNTIAAVACRSQNIPHLYDSQILGILHQFLLDVVPSIQNTAALALARIAGHDIKMAEEIVNNQTLISLLSGFSRKNKIYKKSSLILLRSIGQHSSALSQAVIDAGGLDAIILCLEDCDPDIREEACWTVGYISRLSTELAEKVVDAGAIPLLVVCLQQEEVRLKQGASVALSNIVRHSLQLAQAAVDANAIPSLVRCLKHPDYKLKRQVLLTLSKIAQHKLELAELMVEILGEVLVESAHVDDLLVKRNGSVLVREVVKHSVEMAEYLVDNGGVSALMRVLEDTVGPNRLPAIMAIGHIAAQAERLASAVINAKGVSQLGAVLRDEKEDYVLAASVWAMGQIGKHSSEHSLLVLPKLMELYSSPKISEDLRLKAKGILKRTLKKCTHLHTLQSLLEDAPLPIIKHVLGQFSKVHESRARHLFVITGGLRKRLLARKGVPLHISINNQCLPEDIASSNSSASLLKHLENFEPKIALDAIPVDGRSSIESFRSGKVPNPPSKERAIDEESVPQALPHSDSSEQCTDTARTDEEEDRSGPPLIGDIVTEENKKPCDFLSSPYAVFWPKRGELLGVQKY